MQKVSSLFFSTLLFILTLSLHSIFAQPLSTVNPLSNSIISNKSINFKWNVANDAINYNFDLSTDSLFNTFVFQATCIDNNINFESSNGKYFWRVTANFPSTPSQVSEVNSFEYISPKSLANINLWVAADTGTIITGGAVSQWTDLSGNNFNLTQSTAVNRPIKIDNALSNKATVRFDGLNDNLSVNFGQIFTQPSSFFIVWESTKSTKNSCAFSINLKNGDGLYQNSELAPNFNSIAAKAGVSVKFNNSSINTSYTLHFWVANTLNSKLYENGTLKTSGNNGNDSITRLLLGQLTGYSTYNLQGDIAEIIFYNRLLSNEERIQIEQYLINKYAPAVSLGYDIEMPYKLCDTTITGANRSWFTKWQWSTGDTTSTIRVNKSGTYWVRATNIFGMISSDTILVNYKGQQSYKDSTICLGDTLKYSYSENLPYNIAWSNGDTGLVFKTNHSGLYKLILTDSIGCKFETSFTVGVDSFPLKNLLSSDTTLCLGNRLSGNSVLEAKKYQWIPSGETSTSIVISASGIYHLRAWDQRGCSIADSINVQIKGIAPTPLFGWGKLCNRDTTHFNDQSYPADSISSWKWTINNGMISTLRNPQFVLDTAGNYVVNLLIQSNSGCSKDTTLAIVVNKKPVANFDYSPPCAGVATLFSNRSDKNNGYVTQSNHWYINTGLASAEDSPLLSFPTPDEYEVSLVVSSTDFCIDSIKKAVSIPSTYPSPKTFTIIAPQNNTQLTNPNILFQWNSSEDAFYYIFELAETSDFSNIIHREQLIADPNPSLKLNVNSFSNLFWRVTAYNPCIDSISSEPTRFSIFNPLLYYPKLWIAADTGVLVTGGAVSQWDDISGNNLHLTQSTAANRPVKIDNELSNKAVVRFDGLNDNLLVNFGQNLTQPSTFFIIWKSTKSTKNSCAFSVNLKNGDGLCQNNELAPNFNSIAVKAGISIKFNNSPINSSYTLHSWVANTLNSKLYENGILKVSGNNGNDTITQMFLGQLIGYPAYQFQGDIAELIFIDTLLSANQQMDIEKYLMNKYAPPVSLGYDIDMESLCDTTITGANKPWFTKWLWSTDDTTATIKANKSGSYWVQATNIFGMVSSDTLNVTYPGYQSFADSTICLGDTLHYAYSKNHAYTVGWSNGDSGINFKTSQAGKYIMTLTDTLGCTFRDTFNLYIDSLALRMSLGNDTTLCSGNVITYHLNDYELQNPVYQWSTNDTTATLKLSSTDDYWLKITDKFGCVASDSVNVIIRGKAPAAGFTSPSKCFGESVLFTDLSQSLDTSSIAEWLWDFGDSTTSSLQNPTHSYTAPGVYPITLQVITNSNCGNILTQSLAIYSNPKVNFTPVLGCSNTPIQFINLSTDDFPITQNWWSFGDIQSGSNTSNLESPVHQFDTAGTYPVKLISSSYFGCTDSLTKPVEIRKSPIADFNASTTCFGQTTWLSDASITDTWNSILKRQWIQNGTIVSKNATTSIRFGLAGSYPIGYIIKSLNGCTDTIQKNVIVYSNPIANFNNDSVCLNEPFSLKSTTVIGNDIITDFNWSINNTTIGITDPLTLRFDSVGFYPVRLIAETAHHCSDTIIKPVVVKPIPTANFSYLYDEHSIGYLIQFSNQTEDGSTYQWYKEGSLFSTAQNPLHNFGYSGVFPIMLIAKNQKECLDSASTTILISDPIMDLAISNLTITPIGNYQQAALNLINMSNRNITELWLNLQINEEQIRERWSGMLRPGETSPYQFQTQVHIPTQETANYGCARVESPLFTEETNLDNNIACISLLEDFKIISAYPNPAKDQLNLLLTSPYESAVSIRIFSITGNEVYKWENLSILKGVNRIKLPMLELNNGLYILKVIFNNQIERLKFNIIR